jgi:hypothetical protein
MISLRIYFPRIASYLLALGPLLDSLGTASAEDEDGKHEMKRAPAAITSLSAASRCASRPPSDPSVQSPRNGTRSEMTGFSRIWGLVF